MLTVTVLSFLITAIVIKGIYPAMGMQEGSIAEALSIPFQQTARYMVYANDDVTDSEEEAIRNVLAYDQLAEIYDPTCSDNVKATFTQYNEGLGDYFKAWFTMGLRHPVIYFDAFINLNYGYLAPTDQNVEQDLSNDYNDQITAYGIYPTGTDEMIEIFSAIHFMAVAFPFFRYFTMPGFYNWILLILCVYLLAHKRWKALILFAPSIMNFFVCLASPLCNGLRYEISIPMLLPLLIIWTRYDFDNRALKEDI